MTRVLQVRRGNTAANDKFTGLSGEISYDTDAKTLRVHDGRTLGGFALARQDQLNGGSGSGTICPEFDIHSVPAEFWQRIIATYGHASLQMASGRPMPVSKVSYLDYVFEGISTPKIVKVELVCQTPEAGYAIGDTVAAFGIGSRTNPAPNTFVDNDGLHLRLMLGSENVWVCHKDTGVTTTVTPAKWKALFTVWY